MRNKFFLFLFFYLISNSACNYKKAKTFVLKPQVQSLLNDTTYSSLQKDSLLLLFHKANSNTEKIDLINQIAELHSDTSTYILADEAENQSKIANYEFGKQYAKSLKGLYYLRKRKFPQCDSILSVTERFSATQNYDEISTQCFLWLGECYRLQSKNIDAIDYYDKANSFYNKTQNHKRQSAALLYKGIALQELGNFDSAIFYMKKSWNLAKEKRLDNRQADALKSLGDITRLKGNINQALDYFYKAVEISEKTNYKHVLLFSYISIAELLIKQENGMEAEKYLHKAETLLPKVNDKALQLNIFILKYKLDSVNNDYEAANLRLNKAIKFAEDEKIKGKLALLYLMSGNLATNYNHQEGAIENYKTALSLATKDSNQSIIAKANIAIASLEINVINAEQQLLEAYRLAIKANLNAEIKNASLKLYQLYLKKDNYKDALFYFEKFFDEKERLDNIDSTKNVEREVGNYNLSVQKQIADLKEKQKETEISNQKMQKHIAFFFSLVVAIFIIIIFRNLREKQKLNATLSSKNIKLDELNLELNIRNKEITDSINYSKGIQNAMLPPIAEIKKSWNDLFIFFQPKDIVSGDFYWFHKISDDEFLIACADCTGHGVPGALMSMVCSEKLTIAAKENSEPSKILFDTNNALKETFRQQNSNEERIKDGMELCLLKINTQTKCVSYAGANRLLWIVDKGKKEITETKPTKSSIASLSEFNTEYKQTNLQLKQGDVLYTTTDGYADQFGGKNNKKFMAKQLKDLILEVCNKPISEQHLIFEKTINDWKGKEEQVDDICLLGIML